MAMSLPTWLLRTKVWSSVKAASSSHCWAASLAPLPGFQLVSALHGYGHSLYQRNTALKGQQTSRPGLGDCEVHISKQILLAQSQNSLYSECYGLGIWLKEVVSLIGVKALLCY